MTKYSIAVLGSGGVGKSAITVQFVQGVFVDKYDPTVEESYTKTFEYNKQQITLELMDTAGSEVLTAMRDLYMKKAEGFLIVYSLVMQSTFTDLADMVEQLFRVKDATDVPMVIVGNKCDMDDERTVSRAEGQAFAGTFSNCGFLEASAKTRVNIDEAFEELVGRVIAKQEGGGDSKKQSNCILS